MGKTKSLRMVGEGPDRVDLECPMCRQRIQVYLTGGLLQQCVHTVSDDGTVVPDVVCMNMLVTKNLKDVEYCGFAGGVKIWNWKYRRR